MSNTFKNAKAVNVGTSWVTVYTAGAGVTATVIGLSMSNKLATSISVQARMRDNSDAGAYVMAIGVDSPIEPGAALVPLGGDQKLVLEENDSLEVLSSDVDSLDVLMSLLEQN